MNIAKELKDKRIENNKTQKEIANAIKTSQQAISNWEKGARIPNIEECIKLADYYQISLDELVGREL